MAGTVAHPAFQALVVASLACKNYIERRDQVPSRKKVGNRQLRAEVERHFAVIEQLVRQAKVTGRRFLVEYASWLEQRRQSLATLRWMVSLLRSLDKRILVSDCASGCFSFAAGALTVAMQALAESAAVAAALGPWGLALEFIGFLFALAMLIMKVAQTKKITRGVQEVLEADRLQTERLAAVCNALVELNKELVERANDTEELIHNLGLVDPENTEFTDYPYHRALDIICSTGEAFGDLNLVALEVGTKLGFLGSHQTRGAGAATAAEQRGKALLPFVGSSTNRTNSSAASVLRSSAGSGVVLCRSAYEFLGGTLTICGMSLNLMSAYHALRALSKGEPGEVCELLQTIVKALYNNTEQFIRFHSHNMWIDAINSGPDSQLDVELEAEQPHQVDEDATEISPIILQSPPPLLPAPKQQQQHQEIHPMPKGLLLFAVDSFATTTAATAAIAEDAMGIRYKAVNTNDVVMASSISLPRQTPQVDLSNAFSCESRVALACHSRGHCRHHRPPSPYGHDRMLRPGPPAQTGSHVVAPKKDQDCCPVPHKSRPPMALLAQPSRAATLQGLKPLIYLTQPRHTPALVNRRVSSGPWHQQRIAGVSRCLFQFGRRISIPVPHGSGARRGSGQRLRD